MSVQEIETQGGRMAEAAVSGWQNRNLNLSLIEGQKSD